MRNNSLINRKASQVITTAGVAIHAIHLVSEIFSDKKTVIDE